MSRSRGCAGGALTLALFLVAAPRAAAHALGAECKLVGDRVEVEAFYDDDTPAREASRRSCRETRSSADRKASARARMSASGAAWGMIVSSPNNL